MRNFLAFLVLLFCFLNISAQKDPNKTDNKFKRALQLISYMYVDSVDEEELVETAIIKMLEELDPHSIYISEDEVKRTNEPLEGNFEGVGIQFQVLRDTINVVNVIAGGPSETVGIRAGDKIVKIDDENSTGDKVDNAYVVKMLRGEKGSEVVLGIARKHEDEILNFTIIRDKIPINSVETSYMITPDIGYIKITRFAANTMKEYREAMAEILKNEPKGLILDLRGNGGGYLRTAVDLADEFLETSKMIVYTQGRNIDDYSEYKSTKKGSFEKGKLVVLIDEGSASASEIVTGAIQDWDRGLVIGRRSYGKGLVQRPFSLPDGSYMRITVARYYTPSGRCIQKPYENGHESYYKELSERMSHGELIHPDSITFPDSLRYNTDAGRTVYGGGGIMPDIFIPLDTSLYSDYYSLLIRNNVINSFTLDYADDKRAEFKEKYTDAKAFKDGFNIDDSFMKEFFAYAEKDVEYDEDGYKQSENIIKTILKASLASKIYGSDAYYIVIHDIDDELQKAIEAINSDDIFMLHQIHD